MVIIANDKLGDLAFGADRVAVSSLEVRGRSVELDVTFDNEPESSLVKAAAKLVSDPDRLDTLAKQALAADLESGDEDSVALFRSHHIEELDESDLLDCFSVESVAEIDDEVFLTALQLNRIGLYPEEQDAMLICDYSLKPGVTDYLLAVTFDASGKLVGVAMES